MFIRLEACDDDEFVIRDAETDDELGLAICQAHEDQYGTRKFVACQVLNAEFGVIARLDNTGITNPLRNATSAIGLYEWKYPWQRERGTRHGVLRTRRNGSGWVVTRDGRYLMDAVARWPAVFPTRVEARRAAVAHGAERREDWEYHRDGLYWEKRSEGDAAPGRIEYRLGTVLADATSVIACGIIEYANGGSKPETRDRGGELIARLIGIWYASRFGAFHIERRALEPYFAGPTGSHERMSFSAAAQHYGMAELRRRFPDIDDGALREALSRPLHLGSQTLLSLNPNPSEEALRVEAAWPADSLRELELAIKAA